LFSYGLRRQTAILADSSKSSPEKNDKEKRTDMLSMPQFLKPASALLSTLASVLPPLVVPSFSADASHQTRAVSGGAEISQILDDSAWG
jgi:hypothetical protein